MYVPYDACVGLLRLCDIIGPLSLYVYGEKLG